MRTLEDEKLLRFYKYRGDTGIEDRNLDLISKNRAFFANPKSFNDPFDCAPAPGNPSDEQVKVVLRRLLERNWMPDEGKHQIVGVLASDPEQRIDFMKENFRSPEVISRFMDGWVVFSLSKDPINRLLWSHYGDEHKGFVIEYDIESQLSEPPRDDVWKFIPQPVRYSAERPILELGSDNRSDTLLTKDSVWSYEEEHRIIDPGKSGNRTYDKSILTSVILGARVEATTEKKVRKAVHDFNQGSQNQLLIYRVELDERTYDLYIPGHPLYDKG